MRVQPSIYLPQPGTWLRPVGLIRYAYTLEVLAIHPPGPWDCDDDLSWSISCRRWGQDEAGWPVDDGRVIAGHGLSGLVAVVPGTAWRDVTGMPSWGDPIYYRRITGVQARPTKGSAGHEQIQQLELFAA